MAVSSWRRRLATGVNAALVTVLMVGAGALVVDAVDRLGPRWALSARGADQLSDDLLAAIDAVDERGVEVTITAFTTQKRAPEAYDKDRLLRDVLRGVDARSDAVEVRLLDLDRDRLVAEGLGVKRYGSVVLEGAGDRVDLKERDLFRASGPAGDRSVSFVGEGALAASLRQLLADRHRVVYTLTGHGEHTLFDRGLGELRGLAARVADQGWTARPLDLLDEGGAPEVPSDAAAVMVLGPRAPFAPPEERALRAYLRGGGSLLWLGDPGGSAPPLLAELGVNLRAGVVRAEASYYPHDDRPRLWPRRHPITEALIDDDLAVVLAHVAPVTAQPREGVEAAELLTTGQGGWVQRRADDEPPSEREEVEVGWAVQIAPPASRAPARLVVVGDSDWVDDELLQGSPGNATLVVNALRWLVRADEPLRSVGRPRTVPRVTMSEADLGAVRWALVVVWPGLVALFGWLVVWWRRR